MGEQTAVKAIFLQVDEVTESFNDLKNLTTETENPSDSEQS